MAAATIALGAGGRGRRAGADAGRARRSRDRADRRRHHRLWRRSAGHARPRPAGAAICSRRCPSCRACGCPRSTPAEIDDELWRLIAEEPRLMPHLHLSLQAGDDMILKRMKRRHSPRRCASRSAARAPRTSARHRVRRRSDRRLSRPRPRRCSRTRWRWSRNAASTFLHVFPFSPARRHAGRAHAASDGPMRKERARAPARQRARRRCAQLRSPAESGRTAQVLVEDARRGVGHSEHLRRCGSSARRTGRDRATRASLRADGARPADRSPA